MNIDTQQSSRRSRWDCELLGILWVIDRSKWLCRNLSSHASSHDCAVSWTKPIEPTIYRYISCCCCNQFIWSSWSRWGSNIRGNSCPISLGLPVALAGLLLSVEPLIDMGRTTLNVSGFMTAGVTSARLTGELDTEIYNADVAGQTVEA